MSEQFTLFDEGSMTVYVDDPIFPYRKQLWCHMWCRDVKYLHQFADSLGLKRSWFQNRPGFPHYDLSPSRRQMALHRGATAVSCQELLKTVRSVVNE